MTTKPALSRFRKLVDDISVLYERARKAQVLFAWETGCRIVEEEQDGALRAEYGAQLFLRLSEELSKRYGPGFSVKTLRKMRQFYIQNPKRPAPAELDWNDHVELLPVKDARIRTALEKRIRQENLTGRDIRRLVKEVQTGSSPKAEAAVTPLKRPADLRLNTFSRSKLGIKLADGLVLVDCGFFVSWPVRKDELAGIDLTDRPSYTYAATLERVVDGDTLLVLIEAGFGIIVREKLRLRGVNCPELGTPEGDKAKKFVDKLLPVGSRIVLKSSKSGADKYGRFVVDIFYRKNKTCPVSTADEIIAGGVYLNQQLLDEGHAVRMAE